MSQLDGAFPIFGESLDDAFVSVSYLSFQTDVIILSDLALPLCITAINFVLPFAFSIMASFEKIRKSTSRALSNYAQVIIF